MQSAAASVGDSDSLYLATIINSCISTSVQLIDCHRASGTSVSDYDLGPQLDPNYLSYSGMILELLCEPVPVAVVAESVPVALTTLPPVPPPADA